MRMSTEAGVRRYAVFVDDTKMTELIVFLIMIPSGKQSFLERFVCIYADSHCERKSMKCL